MSAPSIGRPRLTLRRLVTISSLVVVWCALWGGVSVANLVSGTVVAVAVLATGVGPPGRGGIRLGPLVRFAALVALDLVTSTVSVIREVLTPTDHTDEAIVAVPLPTESRAHLLLLVVAITVTPGTAVVDTDPDAGTLYLHLLHADRRDATVAHVRRLAALACAALPVPGPTAEVVA
jgi:multicomponent Na+:H+ antiporter subunit E